MLATPALAQQADGLEELAATARHAPVQPQLDRRVYNVARDATAAGASAAEVLRNIPGIEVDADGNLSVRGDPHVLVLVDGKRSSMFSGSLSGEELRSPATERPGSN